MTDRAELERRYQRLLEWYPRAFRQEHGEEILAVLMAGALDNQRRPSLTQSADLIRNGLLMRLRPRVPRSARTVRAAIRLMYAGAAITLFTLIAAIISLAFVGDSGVRVRLAGHSQPIPIAITMGIVLGLAVIVLWLWLARALGAGSNWARILSTTLFGLATFELIGFFTGSEAMRGIAFWAPTWLVGLAAVWLLWRPPSNAYLDS